MNAKLMHVVTIQAVKESIIFNSSGDMGSGSITVKPNKNVDKEADETTVELQSPVSLGFSLKYLNMFAKAASLSASVTLSLSEDVPLLVEYKMDEDLGYLRYVHLKLFYIIRVC
jgi:proliferating cell nuclear antigen